jgi:Phage integrase, N-terminal SAM-like domain
LRARQDDGIVVGMEVRLLDRIREAIRVRHYSRRTEEAYVQWIRRFILHNGKRHPRDLGEEEASAFVSALAMRIRGRFFSAGHFAGSSKATRSRRS